MKKICMILAALMVVGCSKVKPITTVSSSFSAGSTQAQVREAIYAGASAAGWVVKKVDDNTLQAQVTNRKHEVVVLIDYDANSYDINYKSSKNMSYSTDDNMIHRNYYRWVKKLNGKIRNSLYRIRAEGAR